MRCDTCSRIAVITLQHVLKLGKRKIVWRECVSCWRRAEAC